MNTVDRIAVIEALHMASHNNQVHIEDAVDIINDLHDVYGSLPLQKYDIVYSEPKTSSYHNGSWSYTTDRNSYMYMSPQYDQPMMRGYSRTGSKAEMMEELKQMMNETSDQTVKTAIQDAIAKMNK